MQFLLGLFFFSVLLTTGGSLNCSYCVAINGYCSGTKVECPPQTDICLSMVQKNEDKTQMEARFESCFTKDDCEKIKDLIGKPVPAASKIIPLFLPGAIIKEVVCSKAPPSFASFFPAFLGLLLLKLLF